MKFARLEMLFLIWTLPVLFMVFIYGMRRRRKILNHFASGKGVDAVVAETDNKRRWLKVGLIILSLLFL